jgi:hypothetical protein|tara:strand:+ start:1996 stop:2229 length:234 start_codon:yes stop_codon:yes gene_type:complete
MKIKVGDLVRIEYKDTNPALEPFIKGNKIICLVISEYDTYRMRLRPIFAENNAGEIVLKGIANKGFVYPKYSCEIVE